MKILMLSLLALAVSAEAADSIQGKILLGKGMKAPAGATLFLAARSPGGGPPMAVKRIAAPKFPLEFELSQKDAMMGGPFSGDVQLSAHLSQTGDAMARSPGDLLGTVKTKVGDSHVVVKLDQKI
jgi:cytochrome c-type biogenesis protein CcmH